MTRPFDPRLYAIVDVPPDSVTLPLDRLAAALAGGVTLVQVRGKEVTARQLFGAARELLTLLQPLGVPLIVNDRPDVARAAGAQGVHLGQHDLPASAARRFWPEGLIGLSIHDEVELEAALSAGVDYLAAGSLFATASKDDAMPLDHERFAGLARLSRVPLVGIGGVTVRNAAAVARLGASGVAAIRGLWDADDVGGRARAYRRALDSGGLSGP